jgi:hypothetical protein
MTYPCPKGHDSTDPVWCSECSTRIPAAAAPASATAAAPLMHTGEMCPTPGCGTLRDGSSRFCENCRYDFELEQAYAGDGAPPPASIETAPDSATFARTPSPPPLDTRRWEVVISVDPTAWVQDDEAPAPEDEPDRVFPLDLAEHLIGRRSASPDIHPTIIPDERDHGVSRRHAMLLRLADGSYAVKELGSTNGTKLNGKLLPPGVLTPLAAGDSLYLPLWTCVTLRRREE